MPRDLFGDVTDPSVRVESGKWYTVPLSLAAHAAVVTALLIVPLMATGALPLPSSMPVLVIGPPPPPEPPPPPRPAAPPETRANAVDPSAAPVEPPDAIIPEPFLVSRFDSGLGGTNTSVVDGIFGDTDSLSPVPPPSPPEPRGLLRVGGRIAAPQKVRDQPPLYPAIAQAARVEGIVMIQTTIDENGRVIDAKVLKSVPLLDQAALDAVRQWEYTPTRLNGVPVAVIMTVTVRFQLK